MRGQRLLLRQEACYFRHSKVEASVKCWKFAHRQTHIRLLCNTLRMWVSCCQLGTRDMTALVHAATGSANSTAVIISDPVRLLLTVATTIIPKRCHNTTSHHRDGPSRKITRLGYCPPPSKNWIIRLIETPLVQLWTGTGWRRRANPLAPCRYY